MIFCIKYCSYSNNFASAAAYYKLLSYATSPAPSLPVYTHACITKDMKSPMNIPSSSSMIYIINNLLSLHLYTKGYRGCGTFLEN